MEYKVYLFDFDYTLADSSRGIVTCFRHVLDRHGYTSPTDDDIKRTIGKTLEESFSLLTGVTDVACLAEFRREYVKEADVYMTSNTVLFPEVEGVLRRLKSGGAQLGIISTKFRYRIRELLVAKGLDDVFDLIVGGEDVSAAKPSPEGVLIALDRLHVRKEDVLYVGDSVVDAETAQAAGVSFGGVTHGVTTYAELSAYPHRLIMTSLEVLI